MSVKAILFDLDGVLVDTPNLHRDALNAALLQHGRMTIGPIEHAEQFDGLPSKVKLARLVELGRLAAGDVESVLALKQKETLRLLDERVAFDPAVFCLVAGIVRAGLRWGCVTNAVQATALACLSKLSLTGHSVLVTNEQTKPKPDPAPYLLACARLELPPRDCLVVEDGRFGIQSATAAGCQVLQVKGPHDLTPAAIWRALEC